MSRIAVLLAFALVLSWCVYAQNPYHDPYANGYDAPVNPEMEREELVNMEGETARAFLLNNGTFFHRVYSDDFAGTLSHCQPVDRVALFALVRSGEAKYQ